VPEEKSAPPLAVIFLPPLAVIFLVAVVVEEATTLPWSVASSGRRAERSRKDARTGKGMWRDKGQIYHFISILFLRFECSKCLYITGRREYIITWSSMEQKEE
jgi:hypothetical protein